MDPLLFKISKHQQIKNKQKLVLTDCQDEDVKVEAQKSVKNLNTDHKITWRCNSSQLH